MPLPPAALRTLDVGTHSAAGVMVGVQLQPKEGSSGLCTGLPAATQAS